MSRQDDAPTPFKRKQTKPGIVPDNRIPIFDHKGRQRGSVGKLATSVTVSRFTGTHDNRLGTKDGRAAWLGAAPKGPNKAAKAQTAKLQASLRADKGSVSK
jgi:hypothetical protein